MSLNNIVLSNSLLADLYPDVLVQGPATTVPVKEPVPFLGRNEKNILILVNQKEAACLPAKELDFLTTVLSACGLTLSHVAIVNRAGSERAAFADLQTQLSPKKVLLLDVNPEEMDLPASELFSVRTHQEIEFVAAPPLHEIEKTKQAKSKFWIALKQLFCL